MAVAGATGFVGTAIIDSLLNDYQVRGLTRSVGKISQAAKDDPVEWNYCDVHSSDSVNQALEGACAEEGLSIEFMETDKGSDDADGEKMQKQVGETALEATQRPSVNVITGVIKANIPARIAFQVASKIDSRTILDAMGADKLLGKGDMLYLPPGSAKLIRTQGVLITDEEIQKVVDHIGEQGKPSYEMEIHEKLNKPSISGGESECDEDEELIEKCIEVIRSEQRASASLMQRRLRLGYNRASRIIDELERRGVVGPGKGAEPREILIDLDGGGADGSGQSLV